MDAGAPLRVLFIAPSLRRAGAQTQLVDLVNGLDGARFSRTLYTYGGSLEQIDRLDRASVSFVQNSRRHKLDFALVRDIARRIDESGIEVIHCTMQFALLLGWMARRLARRKPGLVVALHTTVNRGWKEELQDRLLYRWLLLSCDRVVFVCQSQERHWLGKYGRLRGKSTVIYNGIDAQAYAPGGHAAGGAALRARLGIPRDAAVFACVAGFRPEKGHDLLVRAFAALEGQPFLLLAGEGETMGQVRQEVEALGVARRVAFLGSVADVRPVLAAADASVLPSTSVETFSMAMLESMAMERPVIGSDIGGMSEAVVPGETGLLVRPRDVDGLREAMAALMADREVRERMGRAARAAVLERFGVETMVRRTGALLEAVVAG